MNNTNNDLKPGDRVILTGWVNESESHPSFHKQGHNFPCKATFNGLSFYPDSETNAGIGWFAFRFTYQKITDDGNG